MSGRSLALGLPIQLLLPTSPSLPGEGPGCVNGMRERDGKCQLAWRREGAEEGAVGRGCQGQLQNKHPEQITWDHSAPWWRFQWPNGLEGPSQ